MIAEIAKSFSLRKFTPPLSTSDSDFKLKAIHLWRLGSSTFICNFSCEFTRPFPEKSKRYEISFTSIAQLGACQRIAVFFCSSQKTLAASMPIAAVVFAGQSGNLAQRPILILIMIYHALQLIFSGLVSGFLITRKLEHLLRVLFFGIRELVWRY